MIWVNMIALKQERKNIKPWQKYLNPKPHYFVIEEAFNTLNQIKENLAKHEIEVKNAKVIDRALLFEKIAHCGLLKEKITKDIEDFETERILNNSSVRKKIDEAVVALKQKRSGVIKYLNEQVIVFRDEIRTNLEPLMRTVNKQYKVVIREAEKIGKA